jgi:RHS repeat-associated core domain
MPGRRYAAGGPYRYGFNGKENDNEVKGEGNQHDYGMRIYDPRLGRFLSCDPLYSSFPWNSCYAYAENEPISNIDFDGLEREKSNSAFSLVGQGIRQGWRETKSLTRRLFSRETFAEAKSTAKDVLGTMKGDPNAIRSFNKRMLNFSMGINNTIQHYTTQPVMWSLDIPNRSRKENLIGLGYGLWKGFELYVMAKAPEVLGSEEASTIFNRLSSSASAATEGNMIIKRAIEGGARIVIATGDEALLMRALNKQAGIRWIGNGVADIQISKGASRAAILEEAIHYEQYLKYGEEYMHEISNMHKMEIEAKDRLLEIGKKEKWPTAEMDQIKAERASHEKELKQVSK